MTSDRLALILSRTDIIAQEQLDKIPIVECGEPLVGIGKLLPNIHIQMSPQRLAFTGNQALQARETVVKMLGEVAKLLEPNFHLVLHDAYRPIAYQKQRYEQIVAETRERHPDASDEEIRQMVFQVVFPPNENPLTPPPHATGGAVDVSIATLHGQAIDMGSKRGFYDDDDENERHKTNSSMVTPVQRKNRIVLVEAMAKCGFCNYPGEWWHFMYGDREYAAYEGVSHAIYGRADLIGEK